MSSDDSNSIVFCVENGRLRVKKSEYSAGGDASDYAKKNYVGEKVLKGREWTKEDLELMKSGPETSSEDTTTDVIENDQKYSSEVRAKNQFTKTNVTQQPEKPVKTTKRFVDAFDGITPPANTIGELLSKNIEVPKNMRSISGAGKSVTEKHWYRRSSTKRSIDFTKTLTGLWVAQQNKNLKNETKQKNKVKDDVPQTRQWVAEQNKSLKNETKQKNKVKDDVPQTRRRVTEQNKSLSNEINPKHEVKTEITQTSLTSSMMSTSSETDTAQPTPIAASTLQISRHPIICPESNCHALVLVSSLSLHLKRDHPSLKLERIQVNEGKRFKLNPDKICHGVQKCHLVYLLSGKITGFACREFADYVPLMVMTTRVRLHELAGVTPLPQPNAKDDLIMIWVTGVVPDNLPIPITLTAKRLVGDKEVDIVVNPSCVYSIRHPQNPIDLFKRGQMLLMPMQLRLLTNNGKSALTMELIIH